MLTISDLSIHFRRRNRDTGPRHLQAIRHLDLDVRAGEIMAVVGESGSGKSLLAHALLGILPSNAQVEGRMIFKNSALTPERQQHIRGKNIALIPQSVTYLNPFRRVGRQVERAAALAGLRPDQAASARDQAFARYALGPDAAARYPHQISGGMARRVLTATATTGDAELLVADEPTTGLDQNAIRESLAHLRQLADSGKAVLLITHDITAALSIADRVAVFLHGTTVEIANAADFENATLRHPYTRALWRALPQNDFLEAPDLAPPAHDLARSLDTQNGCVHRYRCSQATELCARTRPEPRDLRGGKVRCHHA